MISEDLLHFFPHEKIRGGQEELVIDLSSALSNKKILLAHAPTGLGKTASALSVALFEAQKHKKKVLFLTNRHTQHQIAIHTLKLISRKIGKKIVCADLIGKRWMCSHDTAGLFGNDFNEFCKTIVERGECEFYNNIRTNKGLTVTGEALLAQLQKLEPLHNEELIEQSKEQRMCSYEVSLALAKKADVIIGDYYYLFNPFVQSTLFAKLDITMEDIIVIVDEGHNLPSRVTDMLSSQLTTAMVYNAIQEAKKFRYDGLLNWLQELGKVLVNLGTFESTEIGKERLILKEDFFNAVNKIQDYDELINEIELAADEVRKKQRRSYLGGIASFLDSWKGEDEGFIRAVSEKPGTSNVVHMIRYSCLDPSIVTKTVFQRVHAGVIMSGTLQPTFMYKDLLGIENGVEKGYHSPFPPENRVSLIVPETSTKYETRGDAMYKKISEKCSDISSLIPGNVALFFPSYDLRDRVGVFFLSKKELFWEKSSMSKEEKEEFLQKFKDKKKTGAVLLGVTGGSFAEGVDFPGDLLQGVVIIGLPLGKPDLMTKKTIAYYDLKFGRGWDYGYTFPAINKCLQSAGRCIRSEKDRGAVIYLDERFAWPKYFSCFPREGLIVTKEYEKFLKEFF
ncbi:MAG: ATP-dependent DNA helicase [archaeon]|nr:ATP-dependent DNA helicase [archaeon]